MIATRFSKLKQVIVDVLETNPFGFAKTIAENSEKFQWMKENIDKIVFGLSKSKNNQVWKFRENSKFSVSKKTRLLSSTWQMSQLYWQVTLVKLWFIMSLDCFNATVKPKSDKPWHHKNLFSKSKSTFPGCHMTSPPINFSPSHNQSKKIGCRPFTLALKMLLNIALSKSV